MGKCITVLHNNAADFNSVQRCALKASRVRFEAGSMRGGGALRGIRFARDPGSRRQPVGPPNPVVRQKGAKLGLILASEGQKITRNEP
jgi:hypothetical protein